MCIFLPVPLVGVLLLAVVHVGSQVVPPSWNSTITTSTAERIRLAGAAIDVAIDRLDTDGQFDCMATFATIRRSFIYFRFSSQGIRSHGEPVLSNGTVRYCYQSDKISGQT
ncbi:hypothetical protein B0H19DRAFT_187599 [Mycena capillaripes]|nr:hypothetical protein B0H19DRAFT_187599 [Mycena capillaripes]